MAVSYNSQTRTWQVNGQGSYASQQEAQAADGGGAAAVSTQGAAAGDFMGGGGAITAAPAPAAPTDPNDAPNPANPGGVSNNEAARRQRAIDDAATRTRNANQAPGGYSSQRATADQDTIAQSNRATGGTSAPADYRRSMAAEQKSQAAGGGGQGVPYADAGASAGAAGGMQNPGYAAYDTTYLDPAYTAITDARKTFYDALDSLSGADPFGNQAFLQQATDRAAAQAQGLASGGLSTATARAGNMRQAQGVQASISAQGSQEVAQQRERDRVTAGAQRVEAAKGLSANAVSQAQVGAQVGGDIAQTATQNLTAWLQGQGLAQQDVNGLRDAAIEMYKTGVQQDENALDRILKKYGIDQQTYATIQASKPPEKSAGDWFMEIAGLGIKTAAVASDRRAKFDVRDPDLRDLEDYLGKTKGKLYQYKDPHKSGRRAGLNYGPMAQDLQKSKIGRTLVTKDTDGTLKVDTQRLALADHAALAELAREVRALKDGKK